MWYITIDTGGTFTDCIATGPDGKAVRVKVLSSSCLRGEITGRRDDRTFFFTHNWPAGQDLFAGYTFYQTGKPELAVEVESIDMEHNLIHLAKPFTEDIPAPFTFDITAFEEAPVLAARIATRTPLDRELPPIRMRLGTTRGTNALLEKKGAKTLLLITKGFKDLLYIGNQQRPHLFQLQVPEPHLLYEEVLEVNERLDKTGKVLVPLTKMKVRYIVGRVRAAGVESVAIALLHAWKNPVHEQILKDALLEEGIRFVSLSHELVPAIRLLPRAQTAVVNAYLNPVVHTYLDHISQKLPASSMRIMTSTGGLAGKEAFQPKDSLLSGPAGGVVGAAAVAQSLGFDKVITLDMGGTSTDTARFDGQYDYEYVTRTGGVEMLSPCLNIETVAAGGGSVCWFDGHRLCVGPESAGASPGPACYGAGGPLAITDINLLLGKLDPSAMGIPVNQKRAEEALLKLRNEILQATGIHYSEEELLRGFEIIANEKMAGAIRKISVARGFDPKDYALVAFGGAGGLHACKIAELLGVGTVILPYDGGLLSAYGIGRAQVERFVQRQVLEKLSSVSGRLDAILAEMTREAKRLLREEGFSENEIEVRSLLCYLRFTGQESSLELDITQEEDLSSLCGRFESSYQRLFGHFPGNREIEVESLKVIACGKQMDAGDLYTGGTASRNSFPDKNPSRVVQWETLEPGDRIADDTILVHSYSAAFVEKNWMLETGKNRNLVLRNTGSKGLLSPPRDENIAVNPVELELFTNRFTSIAEEMGAQLQRTAFSVNIKERLDFSCALLDADGELLVNAPHIPVHLGSLGICARLVKEKIQLGPGDVAIVNHPGYGGSHLPDVTLMSAVFTPEQIASGDPPAGYVINRAHHAEIGGKRPGSMPPDATSLEEEGVVILPTYLVEKGVLRWEAMEELLIGSPYPTRALHENLADINAALASLRAGEGKFLRLLHVHGTGKVEAYMKKLKETAADALDEALRPYEGKVYTARETLDDGYGIAVKVSILSGRVVIDFTGTGPVHPFNLNANISIVYSAVIYVLRLIAGKEIPLNEGLMKRVAIVLPEAMFLHPDFDDNPARCPAVVGGNTEVSQRLVDTLLKALAPITQTACSQGTMNNFLFGNDHFGYYETICGGAGAGNGFRGRSAVHQHMTNTRITDPEELEFRYPVRLHRFSIRTGSGGSGRWRGGDGVIREIEFLEDVDMTLLSQHRRIAPYGLAGGEPGKRGRQYLKSGRSGRRQKLKGVDSRHLHPGDRIVIETPGGGGYGRAKE